MSEKIESRICPNCKVITFTEEDIENIDENGECLICENCRLDLQEQNKDDLEDEE